MVPKLALSLCLALAGVLFSGCGPAPASQAAATPSARPTRSGGLTPYHSPAPAQPATPTPPATSNALPSATPTPRTHVVKKGEDMGGIAYQYRVSLEELMAANPSVNPRAMSIGATLTIPQSQTAFPTESAAAQQASPTPLPLESGQLRCTASQEGGLWCFLPVQNHLTGALEGITARFELGDPQGPPVLSQRAFLPLDVLPAGASLPLSAYFPPAEVARLSPAFTARSQILSALNSADDGRYLPTQLAQQKVLLSEDGRSAAITAEVRLALNETQARRVWVAAIAYDPQGQVVGLRRWENDPARPLPGGQALAVALQVYSVAGPIARVELLAEARP